MFEFFWIQHSPIISFYTLLSSPQFLYFGYTSLISIALRGTSIILCHPSRSHLLVLSKAPPRVLKNIHFIRTGQHDFFNDHQVCNHIVCFPLLGSSSISLFHMSFSTNLHTIFIPLKKVLNMAEHIIIILLNEIIDFRTNIICGTR